MSEWYNFYHEDHMITLMIHNQDLSVKTSTWWQAGQQLRSNREGGMVKSCSLKISNGDPLVPWLRVVLKHLVRRASSKINSDFVLLNRVISCVNVVKISMNTLISRDIIKMVNVSMATSLLIGHLRSVGTSTITPSHPEPASHNRSLSTEQCSWKGGKGSPGLCSREESQHRRK